MNLKMDRMGGPMTIKFQSNTKSLISGEETVEIIDLGSHGFADSFFSENQTELASQGAPLVCLLDEFTGLIQLKNLTTPEDRYQGVDYSYTASNSKFAMDHWNDFISYVRTIHDFNGSKILEIGSNDGYLLSLAKDFTSNVLGVDASPYMAKIASESGIPTLVGAFGESEKLKIEIMNITETFDFIFANNVLNHSNNPLSFVANIAELLSPDGVFVFEVPYWLSTITSLHFDQIYHEHVTYLTIKSSKILLATAGLFIRDVSIVDYHGGSIRIAASKNSKDESNKLNKLLDIEKSAQLFNPERYDKYISDISLRRDQFMGQLMGMKRQGKNTFGIGAAAKANTLLTYYGITTEHMAFILDSSPHKQGKITPVSRIPIVGDESVVGLKNGVGVVMAWNLSGPLQGKLLSMNSKLEFLSL